jgi:hypothetical protein
MVAAIFTAFLVVGLPSLLIEAIFDVDVEEWMTRKGLAFILANKGGVYIFFGIPWACLALFLGWRNYLSERYSFSVRAGKFKIHRRGRDPLDDPEYVRRYWERESVTAGRDQDWIHDDNGRILGPLNHQTGQIMTIKEYVLKMSESVDDRTPEDA